VASTENPDEETLRLLLDEEEEEERQRRYEPLEDYASTQELVEEILEEETEEAETEVSELEQSMAPAYQEMVGMEGVKEISDVVEEYGKSFLNPQSSNNDTVGPRTYLANEAEPAYQSGGEVNIDYETQTRDQRGFDAKEEEEDKPRVDPFHGNI
tara:strand:- start:2189 stop:2653 length:465 start_codon:yes stop_codon:yes gene_type:complete